MPEPETISPEGRGPGDTPLEARGTPEVDPPSPLHLWTVETDDTEDGLTVIKDPATGERQRIPPRVWEVLKASATPESVTPEPAAEALGDLATETTVEPVPGTGEEGSDGGLSIKLSKKGKVKKIKYNSGQQIHFAPTIENNAVQNVNVGGNVGSAPETPEPAPRGPETGDRDAEVEALRAEVESLRAEVADLRRELADLTAQLRALVEALNARGEPVGPIPAPGPRPYGPEPLPFGRTPEEPTPEPVEPTPEPIAPTPEPVPPGPEPITPPGPEPTPEPVEPTPGEDDPDAPEGLEALEAHLNTARDELLKIIIRRKARAGDGKWLGRVNMGGDREEDAELYQTAMEAYKAALANYLATGHALPPGAYDGLDEGEIANREAERKLDLLNAQFDEREKLINREFQLNNEMLDAITASAEDQGWMKKMWAKRVGLIRKWSDLSTKKKILFGAGAGVAVAAGSYLAGIGVAGLAAGSAVKFSMGLLNKQASARNVSERSRDQALGRVRDERARMRYSIGPDGTIEEYTEDLVDTVHNEIDGEIQSAQRRNKIGNGIMVLSGVTMVAGATGLEGGFLDLFGGGHGAEHAANAAGGAHHAGGAAANHVPTGGGGGGANHAATALGHEHIDPNVPKVELPPNLHLHQNLDGHYDIVNNQGKVVVGELKNGLFDRQGNLSEAARETLKAQGFDLRQVVNAGRFMTEVNQA